MHEELEARLKEAEKALKDFDYYQDFETSEHLLTIFSQDSKNVILNNASWLVSSLKKSLEREKTMRAALEFYSTPKQPGGSYLKGTRIEFGCGCCAGTIEEDNGCVDYDDDVVGLTAREAVRKIEEIK